MERGSGSCRLSATTGIVLFLLFPGLLAFGVLCPVLASVSAQVRATPIVGDLMCPGTAAGSVEFADGNDVRGTRGGGRAYDGATCAIKNADFS